MLRRHHKNREHSSLLQHNADRERQEIRRNIQAKTPINTQKYRFC